MPTFVMLLALLMCLCPTETRADVALARTVPPANQEAGDPSGKDGALARITVRALDQDRTDPPVSVALDRVPVPLDSGLSLMEIKEGKRLPVPSQIEPGYSPRLWWILSGTTEAGTERVFELVRGPAVEAPAVEVDVDDTGLEVRLQGGRVLRYNHAVIPPPEGAGEKYARSAFIHPLWSPAGAVLTRMHPEDHIHHLGLWNPWTKTKFEGREVDFWNLGKGQGTVRFESFESVTRGPVFGGFRARQAHVDLQAPGGDKVALNETWDVRVFNIHGRGKGAWLLDFTTIQRLATASPLLLEKYRYGGLGFRATAEWNEGDYLTSEGKRREDGQGTRARWCIVHGPTSKGPAGVVFMSHPQNHGHPEPLRIWSHTPMIFFSFCPIQQADWLLEPDKDYVLKYRLYVYDGTMTASGAEQCWQDFGNPPEVDLKRY